MPFVPLLFLPFAGFIALVVVIGVWSYKREQARLATLAGFCASNGWQFRRQDPYGLAQRWPGTPFDSGYDRTAENVVTGEHDGMPMVAFDYSYKEDSTDSKGHTSTSTYHYAVVALAMPCALPELHLGSENLLTRLGGMMGFQDIELESEDFNRRFRVSCPDRKFASDVLSPRTMEFLLANDNVELRLIGSDAVSFDSGELQPYVIQRAAHVLSGLVRGVPSFVWADHGVRTSA